MLDKYQKEILEEILEAPKSPAGNFKGKPFDLNRYLGTPHKLYYINTPNLQKIAKDWSREHQDISSGHLIKLLTTLFKGESFEEKVIAAYILENMVKQRKELDLANLDEWLNHLVGWAEIDTLGTGPFTPEAVLGNFPEWKKWIKKWVKDTNINKRRFALVVLIIPARDSQEEKLADLAFENIDKLKNEQEILITKAISWVLRALIKNHKVKVEEYLKENLSVLPKIAIRETTKKLLTGKK